MQSTKGIETVLYSRRAVNVKDYANNVGLSKGNGDQQSETVDKQPLQVPSMTVSQRLDS